MYKEMNTLEHILKYSCDIWTVYYRLKKQLLSTKNGFLEKSCNNIQNIKRKK